VLCTEYTIRSTFIVNVTTTRNNTERLTMLSALVLVSIWAISFAMEVTEDRDAPDRVATSCQADQKVAEAEKLATQLRKHKLILSMEKEALEIQRQIIGLLVRVNELQREVTNCIEKERLEKIFDEIKDAEARITQKESQASKCETAMAQARSDAKIDSCHQNDYQFMRVIYLRRMAADCLLKDDSRKIENTHANGRTVIVTEEFKEAETMSGNDVRKLPFGQVGIIRVEDNMHMLEIDAVGTDVPEKETVRVPDDSLHKLRYVLEVPNPSEPEVQMAAQAALVQPQPQHYSQPVVPSTRYHSPPPSRKPQEHTWRSPQSEMMFKMTDQSDVYSSSPGESSKGLLCSPAQSSPQSSGQPSAKRGRWDVQARSSKLLVDKQMQALTAGVFHLHNEPLQEAEPEERVEQEKAETVEQKRKQRSFSD